MFFSVEMGNSLQQHRSAIGCFHNGTKWRKKDKKDKMFIWHAKKDLVFSMVFLQLLLLYCDISLCYSFSYLLERKKV